MPWVPRPNAGPDEFDWVEEEPYQEPSIPQMLPAPLTPTTTPPTTTTTTTNTRHPNAGPDGSTTPNMDPPGYVGGYWRDGQWVQGSPRSTGGGVSGFEGGGGMAYSANWPTYTAPAYLDPGVFDPGDPFSFEDFSYQDFSAPTADSMLNEPGFQFRMDQGRKALEASAAGKGTLRSGGTLKDILQYGQNFASQEYGNVYNRALQEYDTNRGNAFGNYQTKRQNAWDNWNTGYGGKKDAYSFLADNYGRQNVFNQNNSQFDFNARQRQAEAEFDDAFRRWSKEGDWIVGSGAD